MYVRKVVTLNCLLAHFTRSTLSFHLYKVSMLSSFALDFSASFFFSSFSKYSYTYKHMYVCMYMTLRYKHLLSTLCRLYAPQRIYFSAFALFLRAISLFCFSLILLLLIFLPWLECARLLLFFVFSSFFSRCMAFVYVSFCFFYSFLLNGLSRF